jgi:hypothetical protein
MQVLGGDFLTPWSGLISNKEKVGILMGKGKAGSYPAKKHLRILHLTCQALFWELGIQTRKEGQNSSPCEATFFWKRKIKTLTAHE